MTSSSDTSDSRRIRRLRRRPLGRYRYVRLRWRVLFAVIDTLGTAVFSAGRALRRLSSWRLAVCVPRVAGVDGHRREALVGEPPGIRRTGGSLRSTPATRRRPVPPNQQGDPKVILLVQLDHLGDAIISTAMLPALRQRYPNTSIEVLAGAWNREVFEVSPEVGRVHVSQINRFARGGLARFAWIPATFWWGLLLRRRKVDLGIDVRGEFPAALILWLCGARRRLGWNCGGGGFLLTDSPDFVPHRPELDSRMALLAALGIGPAKGGDGWRPSFRPGGTARRRIARELAALRADEPAGGPLVVLHVGAGTPAKTWPVEHWRDLLGRIIVGHAARVVLVGSRQDRTIAARVLGGRPWPRVADWTGRLSVMDLAALLERADVLVGADSGPAHLAAAVDTPTVVLFSGTNHPGQWRPRGRRVRVVRHPVGCSPCHRGRCPRADHPCMRLLRPRQVAAELETLLHAVPCRPSGRLTAAAPAAQEPHCQQGAQV